MENASKALLIAGGVLIVILLIAMGMRIFNSTSGTADSLETTMVGTEIATSNSRFTKYIGTKKSYAETSALVNEVISYNANAAAAEKIPVHCAGGIYVEPNNLINLLNDGHVQSGYTYKISMELNMDTGYVQKINIARNPI